MEAVGVPPPPSSVRIKDNILYGNLTEVEAYDAFVLIIGIILHLVLYDQEVLSIFVQISGKTSYLRQRVV